ncbi:MAG: right-handed parallel beta-helix repeat-containing protein [Deltaproteobacteria bacterium]|nr:right-handed parallel beta-helix repeat-containing protein [Deltaproteobacteria bacterium]
MPKYLKISALIFILAFCSCKSSQNNRPADEAPPLQSEDLKETVADVAAPNETVSGSTQTGIEQVQAGGGEAVTEGGAADSNGAGTSTPVETTPIDSDGDSIVDESDNCPNIPNENQEDYNANGIADACEIANFTEEEICTKHLHWWKIDNYKKWRENPNIYPNVKCTKYVDASKEESIQSAVNKAIAGDIICIKPGVYREHHIDEKNSFPAKDDFTGLHINKIATPFQPIVIAGVGEGEVIIDSEYADAAGGAKVKKYRDVGIYVSYKRYDDGIDEFKNRPKFIEIYGLTIQNFKINGLYNRGSCNRFASNIVRGNGNVIPSVNPSALFLIEYDSDGRIVFGNDGKPKPAGYVLTTDGLDNDNDTLIDEADESHEKIDIGRDGIYESNKSIGNMYVANEIYNSGWYSKKVCSDALDLECPMVPISCLDAQITYANYRLFTCDQVKNILIEGIGKDYKCVDGRAYVNFPNAVTAAKVLGSSLKNAALDNAWKGIWAGGHGIYTHGSDSLIIENSVHDNGGEGLSIRDPMKNALIASNKIYNNAAKGIYYISTGRDGKNYPVEGVNNIISKNEIYNNGICSSLNLKAGFYLGPDAYVTNSRGTTITDNYIHDNKGDDFQVQNGYLTNNLGTPNCPDDVLKNSALGGCCPRNNIIEKNKFEGISPIGPKYGICISITKASDSIFLNYLKQNNEIIVK